MADNLKNNKTDKWHDSPELVGALLLFLMPIGLYALLKSKKIISKPVKIIISVILFIVMCTFLYFIITK